MPLILDDEKMKERLESPSNAIFKYIGAGRPAGSENQEPRRVLKPATKAFIGSLARLDGTSTVAKVFEFRPGQVSAMKNASGNNHGNQEIKEKQDDFLKSAKDTVISKMMLSLEAISEDKLKIANPLIAATIAEKMAGIHEKLSPKAANVVNNQAQIIYMAPRQKDEKEYPILEVEAVQG